MVRAVVKSFSQRQTTKRYYEGDCMKGIVCSECGSDVVVVDDAPVCSRDPNHTGVVPAGVAMMQELKTLNGLSLNKVFELFDAQLDRDAYSKVNIGGAAFTNISPAYLTEALTVAFGVCGVGWWFEYKDVNINSHKYRQDKDTVRHDATITDFKLYYRLVDTSGNIFTSKPIMSTGYNQNYVEAGYALKGAITNALGAAASRLCWQLSVYKSERTHAKEYYPETHGEDAELSLIDAILMGGRIIVPSVKSAGVSMSIGDMSDEQLVKLVGDRTAVGAAAALQIMSRSGLSLDKADDGLKARFYEIFREFKRNNDVADDVVSGIKERVIKKSSGEMTCKDAVMLILAMAQYVSGMSIEEIAKMKASL
jgi:hypothetical protein